MMHVVKPLVLFVVAAAAAVRLGAEAGADRVVVAAMRLSEQPNYRWSSVVLDDARTYAIEGAAGGEGYTWVRLPLVPALARRLSRETPPEVEAVFRGSAALVVNTERGWRTLRELPRRHRDWDFYCEPTTVPASRGAPLRQAAAGGDPWETPEPDESALLQPAPLPDPFEDEDAKPYCNAQFALSHPHEELAVIVSSYTDLKVQGDIATGTLSDLGAQLLLVRDGQEQIRPLSAAGTFQLQIRHGIVVRYRLQLEGTMLVGRRRVQINQTSTTQIADIGKTALDVPAEVRRKLDP
jgi:hypothetical protein